jgi:hypothetical protein
LHVAWKAFETLDTKKNNWKIWKAEEEERLTKGVTAPPPKKNPFFILLHPSDTHRPVRFVGLHDLDGLPLPD